MGARGRFPRSAAALLLLLLASCALEGASRERAGRQPAPDTDTDEPGIDGSDGRSRRVAARVSRVVDGDTVEVRLDGEELDVRLIGIDAPESVHPTEPIECFGPEASAFTEQRLEGSRVGLEFDIERLDPFGRTLAYVWVGRRLFNEDIVRQGYATVTTFPPNVAHVERFVEAERKARRDGLGLWGACLRPVNTGADWRALGDDA